MYFKKCVLCEGVKQIYTNQEIVGKKHFLAKVSQFSADLFLLQQNNIARLIHRYPKHMQTQD